MRLNKRKSNTSSKQGGQKTYKTQIELALNATQGRKVRSIGQLGFYGSIIGHKGYEPTTSRSLMTPLKGLIF